MIQSSAQGTQVERRVAVWVTREEAEAFLSILLHAPESPDVSPHVAEELLILVAEAQREFSRPEGLSLTGNGNVATMSCKS